MSTGIKNDMKETLWVDGLQRQVKLRKNRLKELMDWCSILKCGDSFHLVNNIQQQEMASLFCDMNYIVSISVKELDNYNKKSYHHVHKNRLITNEEEQHLPITVFLLLTPMVILQFLNRITLLFGRYATYLDLSLHVSIRDLFWSAKIIGMNDDKESSHIYSN